jgi:transposase
VLTDITGQKLSTVKLLSHQGYTIKELSNIFQVDRITIYNWFDHWESRRFAGLYDRKGKGPRLFLIKTKKNRSETGLNDIPKT